ncbi:MAG: isoprenylcysteine carboxylmethyltransferase family protein [Ignavibacteria bacterium]
MADIQSKIFKYRNYTPVIFTGVFLLYRYPNIWSLLTGFVIVTAGLLLRIWGAGYNNTTNKSDGTEQKYFIISGPFSYIRNPLYAGNILIYNGLGVMSFALFPYLTLFTFTFFCLQYRFIIKGEDVQLLKEYGKDFEKYKSSVAGLFPKLNAYKDDKISRAVFSFKSGIESERKTIQAIGLMEVTLFVIWFIGRY